MEQLITKLQNEIAKRDAEAVGASRYPDLNPESPADTLLCLSAPRVVLLLESVSLAPTLTLDLKSWLLDKGPDTLKHFHRPVQLGSCLDGRVPKYNHRHVFGRYLI